MVNPISANAGSLPYAPYTSELVRPESFPEPAVKVTALDKAINSGNASTAPRLAQVQAESDDDAIDKALENVNDSMEAWATGMRFDVDRDAQRIVVSIIDSATGEVLRTVPSDAVIRVAKMIVQLQGKSIDTKA